MEKNKLERKFRETLAAKILRWLFLTLFMVFFAASLLFYNLSTVTTEKNIKTLGEKIVRDFLLQNKDLIDENYDSMIEYAKLFPEQNLDFSSGLQGLNINIKAKELTAMPKEEFYDKLPVIIADNIYRSALDSFITVNVENNKDIPAPIKSTVSRFKSKGGDFMFGYLFKISLVMTIIFLAGFFALQKIKRSFFEAGVSIILVSLPVYLILYLTLPLANNVIRQTDFSTLASLIIGMTEQIKHNYLLSTFAGFSFVGIGLLVISEINIKSFFKKRSEYERIIK